MATEEIKLSNPKAADITGKLAPFEIVSIRAHQMEPISGVPVMGIGPVPDQPILMSMPGQPYQWLPVFSREEDLRAAMDRVGIKDYKIKLIEDGREFAESIIDAGIRIMLDPRVVDGNKTRWTEIVLD